jgi:hypothetical protein
MNSLYKNKIIKSITKLTGCNTCLNTGINLKSYPDYLLDTIPNPTEEQITDLINTHIINAWKPNEFDKYTKSKVRNFLYTEKCPECNGTNKYEVTLCSGWKFTVNSIEDIQIKIDEILSKELEHIYVAIES